VWVNGALVEDYTPGEHLVQPHYDFSLRAPVVLRAGRNTILVKSQAAAFTLRIGDTPRDRAVLLGEQRRFAEAFATLNELSFSRADLEGGFVPWSLTPVLTTHNGPQDRYRLECEAALARLAEAEQQTWLKFRISYVCSQRANPLFDEHAERLASLAEEFAAKTPDTWTRLNAALVNYRAGRFERAQSLLTPSDLSHPLTLPLQALLRHKLGDADAAADSLEAAFSAAAEIEENTESADRSDFPAWGWACWWYEWGPFVHLLAEAEQAIRGVTTATDELTAATEKAAAQRWTTSPETAVYDQAVLFTARGAGGLLKYPEPLLARARRLVELGRFQEAEADYNKAIELAPEDSKMLTARADFHAQRGDIERAAADFGAAFELASRVGDENYVRGLQVGRELANHDAVLTRVAELRPDDYRIWLGRGMHHADHGRWTEAAADYLKTDRPHAFFILRTMELAGMQWLAGDVEGHRATCQFLLEQQPSERLEFQVRRGTVVACGIAPEGNLSAAELVERAELLARDKENDLWVHLGLAIALFRAGRFDDARLQCEKVRPGPAVPDESLARAYLRVMCLHQLGRSPEAQQLLQAAQAWSAAKPTIPALGAEAARFGAPEITMFIVRQTFERQATELLQSQPGNRGKATTRSLDIQPADRNDE
jgi:tetratricopeptide (TPR) repeat protein